MTDRLPDPLAEGAWPPMAAERASATPSFPRARPEQAPATRSSGRHPQTLHELQAWMVDAICGSSESASVVAVAESGRLSARDRLNIYRRGYAARLTECLGDDYPVLAATLGARRFDALCHEYIDRHPSRSASLNAFGRHMASVCATTRQLETGDFCAELASLEWALVEVTHAQAPAPLDLAELQRIPAEAWSSARLIPADSLRLLHFGYPIDAYYQAYRSRAELMPLPAAAASATAVYRRDTALWRMDLTPAMSRVLRALLAGDTIARALGQLGPHTCDAAALAEAERSVMIWFSEWVRAGFFSEVVAGPPP